jgi:Ca-activated chloride channel family protein
VTSTTHALAGAPENPQVWSGALAAGRVIDNRDFVLHYTLAGAKAGAGLLAYKDSRGGFFSLLLEPPAAPAAADITPREMVFLLDCSGSMDGLPLDASKAFMRAALRKLRPTDTFRIVRFSDNATEFSRQPLAATRENVEAGIRYTDALNGEGGTMMTSGIEQALAPEVAPGSLRIVTFLTDGYIGNEQEILAMIKRRLNGARLYAFGVGTGVNRYLMNEIGRAGRGFTRYMDPTEDTEKVAAELTDKLQSPVLTDISVDWGELKPTEIFPAAIPDLFAGGSLRIQGRYAKPGLYKVTVKGRVNGYPASLPLMVSLPAESKDGEAVALVWARSAIREAMYQLSDPQNQETTAGYEQIKTRVTDLGLNFSLLTRWTAFVAVSEKVYNTAPADTKELPVPLPMVKGVTAKAYGNQAAFTGAAGPEPAQWLGLGLLGLMLILFFREQQFRKSVSR